MMVDTRFSVDAGNGYLKARYNGRTICEPSFIREVDSWQDVTPGPGTAVVELNGRRWIVGRGAGQLNGRLLFEAGKAEHYHLMVFAALALLDVSPEVTGLELKALVPDRSGGEWADVAENVTQHESVIVNGREYADPFRSVELFSEGEPIWKLVQQLGMVPEEFMHDRVAVMDLGSGDATAYLFTLTGDIDWDRAVMLPGLKEVAAKVAAAIRRKPGMKGLAKPDVILDLIRQAKYVYRVGGAEVPFDEEFHAISDRWVMELGKYLVNQVWSDIANEIGIVYVTGGASGLAQPLVEKSGGRFEILRVQNIEPQVLSAYAMSVI